VCHIRGRYKMPRIGSVHSSNRPSTTDRKSSHDEGKTRSWCCRSRLFSSSQPRKARWWNSCAILRWRGLSSTWSVRRSTAVRCHCEIPARYLRDFRAHQKTAVTQGAYVAGCAGGAEFVSERAHSRRTPEGYQQTAQGSPQESTAPMGRP